MTDYRLAAERALKEITAALDTLAATITAALDNLAAVGAPAPTIAEKLREEASWAEEIGAPVHGSKFRALADRADKIEQDAVDRQEWNRNLTKQVATLTRERDDARAEVHRLTAERNTQAPHNHDWLAGMKDATRYAVNATLTPADVKPGEAWIVECRGERRTAVKDMDDDVPWNTVAADGLFFSEENENVTLVSRLVPAPRVITNPVELDALAERSIVRDHADGEAMQKFGTKWVPARTEHHEGFYSYAILPATVLWEPEA